MAMIRDLNGVIPQESVRKMVENEARGREQEWMRAKRGARRWNKMATANASSKVK